MDLYATPFRGFVKISEVGSFTRAAEALNISQPALSASIRELERQLGFKLFERSSRRVEVTSEGRAFLANAKRIVLESEWLHQKAAEIRTNELRVAVQHHSILFPVRTGLTDGFIAAHPRTAVKILALGHVRIFEALNRDEVDLALVLEPADPIEEGGSDGSIERLVIARRPIRLAISELAARSCSGGVRLAQFEGLPVAAINRLHGVALAEAVARCLSDARIKHIRPPEGDVVSVLRYAAATGIAAVDMDWLPENFVHQMCNLVSLPVIDGALSTQLSLLRRRKAQRPAALEFWTFAETSRAAENWLLAPITGAHLAAR